MESGNEAADISDKPGMEETRSGASRSLLDIEKSETDSTTGPLTASPTEKWRDDGKQWHSYR